MHAQGIHVCQCAANGCATAPCRFMAAWAPSAPQQAFGAVFDAAVLGPDTTGASPQDHDRNRGGSSEGASEQLLVASQTGLHLVQLAPKGAGDDRDATDNTDSWHWPDPCEDSVAKPAYSVACTGATGASGGYTCVVGTDRCLAWFSPAAPQPLSPPLRLSGARDHSHPTRLRREWVSGLIDGRPVALAYAAYAASAGLDRTPRAQRLWVATARSLNEYALIDDSAVRGVWTRHAGGPGGLPVADIWRMTIGTVTASANASASTAGGDRVFLATSSGLVV